MLIVVVVAAIVGIVYAASTLNMNAPVDSSGNTVSAHDNETRENVTALTPIGITAAGFIAIIAGVIVLFSIIIYFALGPGTSNFHSRY